MFAKLVVIAALVLLNHTCVRAHTCELLNNQPLISRLGEHGLVLQTISWEDTARNKGSCWGPNIADMTLNYDRGTAPVIRYPNFSDRSVDFDISGANLMVGNEDGTELREISFKEYLGRSDLIGSELEGGTLFRERDEKVLASAQACILPLHNGSVNFHVDLYSYQSMPNEPAVLVIVSSAQGTSAQVVERGSSHLYFNKDGEAYDFSAHRLEDDRKARGVTGGKMTQDEKRRNSLLIIQVPLKIPERVRSYGNVMNVASANVGATYMYTAASVYNTVLRGIDYGILEKGSHKGEFRGTRGLKLVRDDRYPIRVTMQFYMLTDDPGNVPDEAVDEIAARIRNIYEKGKDEGSLVTEETGRVTEPIGVESL